MKFIGIIPARYASTRFPGKPLAILGGKTVIQRVYEQVVNVLGEAYVATDDERIFKAVEQFGGRAVMTRNDHKSGTDRIEEAAQKIKTDADVIINIQGDEPFIQPEQIETLMGCFDSEKTEIATLVRPYTKEDTLADLENPNTPKVAWSKVTGEALLFSRSVIPYLRGVDKSEWLQQGSFYRHIGLYAYRADVLAKITQLEPSPIEKAESLEQMRWMENGFRIRVGITDTPTIGIDTPEDLEKAIEWYKYNG
jgi:3-deoxy-manno-octulosonate cytidylyltransferase (CMP-KDO synthetase)